MPKLGRAVLTRAARHTNKRDDVGRIRVQIMLLGKANSHQRGNIVRSFHVRGTSVSSVAFLVEKALFEGQ